MSALSEQIFVFAVMSVLVALFTWIYLRDPQREFGLWLLGWSAIFVHFATPVAGHFLPLPESVIEWTSLTTLVMAGTFFLLSVSEVFRNPRQRAIFMLAIGLASVLYATGIVFHVHWGWFYVALLSTSIASALFQAIRFYGFRSLYFYTLMTLLVPYSLWVDWQSGAGHAEYGLDFYLFGFFTVTAMAYFRRFRRFTPGVVFSSASFLAWGLVFPTYTVLHLYSITVPWYVWDFPKFAVAFGMILTLFENQTAVAKTAAHQFESLFERNMAAVYVSTFEGDLLDCNSSFLDMYGFDSKEDARATPALVMYVEPSEREAFLQELARQGQVLNYECRQRRKDGSLFWILERVSVIVDVDGRRLIEGTAIDITERKQAELGLKHSEERFATIFRESPIGCVILTLEGVFLDINDAMLRTLARTAEAVVGKDAVELGLWKSQQERDEFYSILRAEGSVHGMEVAFEDANGKRHEGLYSATLVRIAERQCIRHDAGAHGKAGT
jgi:PAS domain S-box-containing protein